MEICNYNICKYQANVYKYFAVENIITTKMWKIISANGEDFKISKALISFLPYECSS